LLSSRAPSPMRCAQDDRAILKFHCTADGSGSPGSRRLRHHEVTGGQAPRRRDVRQPGTTGHHGPGPHGYPTLRSCRDSRLPVTVAAIVGPHRGHTVAQLVHQWARNRTANRRQTTRTNSPNSRCRRRQQASGMAVEGAQIAVDCNRFAPAWRWGWLEFRKPRPRSSFHCTYIAR
jgi:hypothetical protein